MLTRIILSTVVLLGVAATGVSATDDRLAPSPEVISTPAEEVSSLPELEAVPHECPAGLIYCWSLWRCTTHSNCPERI